MQPANALCGRHLSTARVRATATVGICDMLRRDGVDPSLILGSAGLYEDDLDTASSWLPLSHYCDLLEQASDYCGSAAFGLKVGISRHADLLGELGTFVKSAPTLHSALSCITGHFSILQERTAFTLRAPNKTLLRVF